MNIANAGEEKLNSENVALNDFKDFRTNLAQLVNMYAEKIDISLIYGELASKLEWARFNQEKVLEEQLIKKLNNFNDGITI